VSGAAATTPRSRWAGLLMLAFVLALTLPFDPCWLDFEQSRRALLLVLLGATALVAPRQLARKPAGETWLLLWVLWGGIGLVAAWLAGLWGGSPQPVWSLGMLQALHLLCLCGLLRLAATSGADHWHPAILTTALLTSLFGLLQHLGVVAWTGYGTPTQPVSVFGNLNVAAEFTAVAGAVAASSLAPHRWLPASALVACSAYALVNGSRSALVALPAAALFCVWAARRAQPAPALLRRLLPILLVLAGGLLGALLPTGQGSGAATTTPSTNRTATIEVRLEIAKSGAAMVWDDPLFGSGLGQFAARYPLYRSQQEIELSTFGRREARQVQTAHDDWLQAAIEGGVPGLLLLLLFSLTMWVCGIQRPQRSAPLVALFLLMLVRSPLGNAPAVAIALLSTAAPLDEGEDALPGHRMHALLRSLGLLTTLLGAMLLFAQQPLADYLRQRIREQAPLGDPALLESSTSRWPLDATAWQLLAQERAARATNRDEAEQALQAAEAACRLRPNEPTFLLLAAELLVKCDRPEDAEDMLERALRIDPGNPQTYVQLAAARFTRRDFAGTMAALQDAPPQRLRRQLAERYEEFARLAVAAREIRAHLQLRAEAALARTMAKVLEDEPALAKAAFDLWLADLQLLDQTDDPRVAVLGALLALQLEDRDTAAAMADQAGRLTPLQRRYLKPHIDRLRQAVPAWARALQADGER
jgi:O-antigen ligase/tetratricopeptide (TPR) repeat protein